METKESLRKISRTDWSSIYTGGPTFNQIDSGSLARIADALELMVNPYKQLLDRVKYQSEDLESLRKYNARLERRVRGLRGALTRKKRVKQ